MWELRRQWQMLSKWKMSKVKVDSERSLLSFSHQWMAWQWHKLIVIRNFWFNARGGSSVFVPPHMDEFFHALRCFPSRCVHVYAWTHLDGTQRMKNASVWGGVTNPRWEHSQVGEFAWDGTYRVIINKSKSKYRVSGNTHHFGSFFIARAPIFFETCHVHRLKHGKKDECKKQHVWSVLTRIWRFAWKRTFPANRLIRPANCLSENLAGITERLTWP